MREYRFIEVVSAVAWEWYYGGTLVKTNVPFRMVDTDFQQMKDKYKLSLATDAKPESKEKNTDGK